MPFIDEIDSPYGHPAAYPPFYRGNSPLAPRTVHIPGQTWKQLIESDPRYLAKKNSLDAQGVAAAADRQARIRAALIKLGMVPNLQQALQGLGLTGNYANWLQSDVDQNTLNQAQNNEFSFNAQEGRQHDQNLVALQDVLAAKGLLHSGQTGYDTGQENLRHQGALSDAVQNLLGYLQGQYTDYASGDAQRAGDLGDYAGVVEGQLMDEGVSPAPSPGDAVYDPTLGVFLLDGKAYNESGQEVPMPAPPPTTSPPPANEQSQPLAQQAGPINNIAWRRAARRLGHRRV